MSADALATLLGGGRIVLARRWTGLGDCVLSLLAAHRYAKATGRALVVDWRYSCYAPPERNLFSLVFEPIRTWDGVPVLADDRVAGLAHPGPYWPPIWSAVGVNAPPVDGERGDARAAVALIEAGTDVAAPVVVFDGCIAPAAPPVTVARQHLHALRVHEPFVASVGAFRDRCFAGRPVVGVHVRHGNGGAIGGHAHWWKRPGASLLVIADAIRVATAALRRRVGGEPVVFVATDSAPVEEVLRRLLPAVVTRPKRFHPPGAGELHRGFGAAGDLDDALVEMLLLAEVDVLLRYPPGSYYSYWGATMKRASPIETPPDAPGAPAPVWA